MLLAQYLAQCRQALSPYYQTSSPAPQKEACLQEKYHDIVHTNYDPNLKIAIKNLHTHFVTRVTEGYRNNPVTGRPLPSSIQLRFNSAGERGQSLHCTAPIWSLDPSPDVNHLFHCPAYPMSFEPEDLWTRREMRSTTSNASSQPLNERPEKR